MSESSNVSPYVYRLLLADDHIFIRQAFGAMLEREPDLTVVGEAGDGQEAIRLCETLLPDLVLMDLWMPNMNGLEATTHIRDRWPHIRVLALTMDMASDVFAEALKAGAAGCLMKSSSIDEILVGVREILNIGSTRNGADEHHSSATYTPSSELSPRERAVLDMISAGFTNREISARLNVSLSTVKVYVQRILKKLSASTRTEAAVKARRLPYQDLNSPHQKESLTIKKPG